ncbi:MAG: AAA family ATPase [Lachnospiraceae bacterium]
MKHLVITIARHYGSGGRTVGLMLAKELGIHCYDREILRMASDESGISEQLFEKADERLKNNLFRISKNVYKGQLISPKSGDFVSDENLFNYQAKVIKELAESESCIIVGRCADYVLKDHPDVTRIYVYADEKFCLERSKEFLGMMDDDKEVQKFIEKTDKFRGDYYKYYTGKDWDDARNYDLCLNSGVLGFEKTVEEIKAYLRVRFGEDVI